MKAKTRSEKGDQPDNQEETMNEHQMFVKERLEKMYSCPPNDEEAELHKAASSFGYNPAFQKGQKITVCPCCELPINTINLPITISTTPTTNLDGKVHFFVLDSGASLFFTFIKMTIVYLGMLFVISNLYPVHTSYFTDEYCRMSKDQCGDSWYIKFSPVKFSKTNYSYNYDIINILNVIMIGASIIFFVYFRKYQYDIYEMLDLHNETQDDFAVIVKDIPIQLLKSQSVSEISHQSALKRLFEEKIDDFLRQVKEQGSHKLSPQHRAFKKLMNQSRIKMDALDKVKSISLCFDLHDMETLLQERDELIDEHVKKGNTKTSDGSQTIDQVSIPDKICELNNNYIKLCKAFLQQKSTQSKTHFIGKAFVSFEFQHYRNYIIHLYNKKPEEFVINGQQIRVRHAAYPSDVFWFNLKISKWTRIKNILLSYLALVIVLVIVFVVITAIQVGQSKIDLGHNLKDDSLLSKGIGYGFTVLIALIVYLVNYLLGMILKYMTDKERHQTKTKHLISLIIKMFLAQFLNTAGMYFFLSFRQGQHYLINDGLVVQISNLMIISGFISVPLNFFQIDGKLQWFWKKFKYGFLYHDLLFQIQYNQVNQLPEFDFADRYCFYLVQLFTLAFYSYINPICVPAIIIIAVLHYWIDKYNLLKCSSNTFPMNFVISRAVLKIFQLSIIAFAGGNYYFSLKLTGEFSLINFIGLMVAAGYAVLAVFSPAALQSRIFGNDHEIQARSYTQCFDDGSFRQTYWGCNPATMFVSEPSLNRKRQCTDLRISHEIGNIYDLNTLKSRGESLIFQ